jgi:hypothetical protein
MHLMRFEQSLAISPWGLRDMSAAGERKPIIVNSGTYRSQKVASSSEDRSKAEPEAVPAEEITSEAGEEEFTDVAEEAEEEPSAAESEAVLAEEIIPEAPAEYVAGVAEEPPRSNFHNVCSCRDRGSDQILHQPYV